MEGIKEKNVNKGLVEAIQSFTKSVHVMSEQGITNLKNL
jgi:hypothetical protein